MLLWQAIAPRQWVLTFSCGSSLSAWSIPEYNEQLVSNGIKGALSPGGPSQRRPTMWLRQAIAWLSALLVLGIVAAVAAATPIL
jgi:hypothetical protein